MDYDDSDPTGAAFVWPFLMLLLVAAFFLGAWVF